MDWWVVAGADIPGSRFCCTSRFDTCEQSHLFSGTDGSNQPSINRLLLLNDEKVLLLGPGGRVVVGTPSCACLNCVAAKATLPDKIPNVFQHGRWIVHLDAQSVSRWICNYAYIVQAARRDNSR